MEAMDGSGIADNIPKGHKLAKGSSVTKGARKSLANISNLQEQVKEPNLKTTKLQLPLTISTEEYVQKLQKENMGLRKTLVDKNKIIESHGIELQKLRIDLHKLQQQNVELAQAHTQMLAEFNSGKDKQLELNHELGCKNGLLQAMIARGVMIPVQAKQRMKTRNVSGNEVGTMACEPFQADRENTRLSFKPSTVESTQAKDDVDERRSESERASNVVLDLKDDDKARAETKRISIRRNSNVFKPREPIPVTELLDAYDAKKKINKKRVSERRQSARFISQGSAAIDELSQVEDAKSQVNTDQTLTVPCMDYQNENSRACEAQETKRRSVGRPIRQVVEKVQSYKETPINVKMRREK